MSGKDDEAQLTVPKFSSFKSKSGSATPDKAEQKDKHTVPKFSSFKSTRSESASTHRGRSEKKRDEPSDDGRKRHRHEKEDSHESKRRRHESHQRGEGRRRRSKSPEERSQSRRSEITQPRSSVTSSEHFFIDKKGDPLIIKYGGIERSKIPPYYRYGGGRVLGTTGRLWIHREGARDQFSLRMPGEGSLLFKDKDGLRTKRSRLRQEAPKLRPRKTVAGAEGEEGYLAITSSTKPGREEKDGDSEDDAGLPDYRAIEGRAKGKMIQIDHPSESDDEESAEEDEIPSLDESNPLRWRSIQLSRLVKEHPEDIDAWIELVDHQDVLLRAGESLDHKVTENEAQSYTEIKVSMLESALANTTTATDRNRVLNYLMREGVKIWNPKVAEKKWSEVLEDERHNFVLWKTHLDYCMSNIGSFQYDSLRQMLLSRLHQAVARFPDGKLNDFSEAIYVFLRITRFMYDAGFKEMAVGSWQALLEITFFRPPKAEGNKSLLSGFQDFWESEVPRFGEPDAQGWKQYAESVDEAIAPDPLNYDHHAEDSRDSFKAWANAEMSQGKEARLPARTMDEGTEHDPYRVVMYSDIQSFLFVIPIKVLPDIGHQILDAFLIFLGLPPYFRSTDWTEVASQDQFLTAANRPLAPQSTVDMREEDPENVAPRPPIFDLVGLRAACTTDILFSDEQWFKFLDPALTNGTIEQSFILRSLQQLVQAEEAKALAPYYLGLASRDEKIPVRKTAKSLLKRFPTNVGLYVSYAMAEYTHGQRETAFKVLSSAADIAQGDTQGNDLLLWKTWAWLELEKSNKALALKRLCSAADEYLRKSPNSDYAISGSYVLKARQQFSSAISNMGQSAGLESQVGAECLALLAYLTVDGCSEPSSVSQGNITAAMASIDESSREFVFRRCAESEAHEGVLQFAARLLYLNATKGPFRRAHMRGQLTKFLNYFPRNTILLSLLEWSDSSLRVVDETRTLLYDKILVPKHDCVSSRLFAIQHEMHRGNANSTRAAYEHAVTSDACKSSVQIWTSYVRFCHGHKELRAKAKDVFYRALRHCPWSKEIMMEAFVTLIRDMKSEELRSVYETMTSKGLRIHVDLEDFLKKRQDDKARRDRKTSQR